MYGVSADVPSNHAQLIENRDLHFQILSDPEATFFRYTGVADNPDVIKRGYALFSSEGELLEQRVTDHLYTGIAELLDIQTD